MKSDNYNKSELCNETGLGLYELLLLTATVHKPRTGEITRPKNITIEKGE